MAQRTFRDRNGRTWTVWDVRPTMAERRTARGGPATVERRKHEKPRALVSPQLTEGWLAFECKGERCRYAPIPSEWLTMTDEEFVALLARATSRRTTRRLIE